MFYFKIIFILLINTLAFSNSININGNTEKIDILSNSKIYIDKTRALNIEGIQNKSIIFENNNEKALGFGYDPKINIWIKFSLHNKSNKKINKILEYDNALTTDIEFYSFDKQYKKEKEGLFNTNINRSSFNPTFNIKLEANEIKTYYIKASSRVTTLIVKLNLWDNEAFIKKELSHQLALGLFFGAMFILGMYNLFIFFFTRDISYLFYVLYIFGIIIHHFIYVGFANIYLLSQDTIKTIVENASLLVAFPIISLALFTKYFLQIKNYSFLNKILNIFLIVIFISLIVFALTEDFNRYRNLLTILLLFYLLFITIYLSFKRKRQALFILFGWSIISTSVLLMFLSSVGIFDIYKYSQYIVEISLVLEAIVFSIALADRINSLQNEKNHINEKLINQQKTETKRLSKKVKEKTEHLSKALDEKDLLLKELNHRVKNNMQTIVSLIRLQNDEIKDEKLNHVLITIQNRINAMSHLHELLYRQDDITLIDAYEYFEILVEEVKYSYEKDVEIKLDIKTNLEMEQAIYCGLILNELISNSYKHAFPNNKGIINIILYKEKNINTLIVKDNGVGYKKTPSSNSLGLTLVETLAVDQLDGRLETIVDNGVTNIITWKKNSEKN